MIPKIASPKQVLKKYSYVKFKNKIKLKKKFVNNIFSSSTYKLKILKKKFQVVFFFNKNNISHCNCIRLFKQERQYIDVHESGFLVL